MSFKRILSLVLAALLMTLFAACAENKQPASATGISSVSFYAGANEELAMKVGEKERGHVKIEGNDDYKLSDLVFVSTDPSVVSFEYDKTMLTNYVYYTVKALSAGEAEIYVKTFDGIIESERIKVSVREKKATTTSPETTKAPELTESPEITLSPETTSLPDGEQSVTYILNTNTKKYHIEGCSSAEKIKAENKSIFSGDPSELIGKGYSACKNCLDK